MTYKTMDFFQSQDSARRRSGLLIFYYILSVFAIIFGIYAAYTLALTGYLQSPSPDAPPVAFWNPERFFMVSSAVLLIVLGGTLYKVKQLSAGGASVAELLGGRKVTRNTSDPNERKLLNIVEEISIASGVQVPRVYVLEREEGINAFAAGFKQDDAAVAVTKGAIEKLSRDELQGVIAHEFSHILNGDMRLNIKLMGVLYGIMAITFIGYTIFRLSIYSPRRRRSSRSGGGGGAFAIIILSLALMIIGYIGVIFGKIIKSAVSRQREYLADAAAVQFTRNPSGIANALKKIGGLNAGSKIKDPHAQEASHLFFANGLSGAFASLMATHPPLDKRIKRIDPAIGKELKSRPSKTYSRAHSPAVSGIGGGEKLESGINPQSVVASVGSVQAAHLNYAAKIMKNIPGNINTAARESTGAAALVYALLLSSDNNIKAKQKSYLKENTSPEVFGKVNQLSAKILSLPVEYRVPVLDIAISTLKNITHKSYLKFKKNIKKLIAADGKISLFEYTVHKMILSHLQPAFSRPQSPKVRYHRLKPLQSHCRLLLSLLAHNGIDDESKKAAAFKEGAEKIGMKNSIDFLPEKECSRAELDEALDAIKIAAPGLKKKIIDACVSCIMSDGRITVNQAELIRVTADVIDCPVPLLIPGKASSPKDV
ncbi:MAG: M48 family metallopeptidase [Elusimicrobiota bacterium]